MKIKCICLFICSIGIALSLLLFGCARNIKSGDLHQLQVGSPLSGIDKKTFAIKEFVDVRGTDPNLVGRGRGLNGATMDQPVSNIITAAISKEFERNGHNVLLYTPQSKADFIIEGTIYKFSLVSKMGQWEGEFVGNVGVKVTTINASDSNKVLVRKYEGEYGLLRSFGISTATLTEILDRALLGMIKDMSVDQELLNFLQK